MCVCVYVHVYIGIRVGLSGLLNIKYTRVRVRVVESANNNGETFSRIKNISLSRSCGENRNIAKRS